MNWIDQKYINSLATRLSMFTRKDDNVYNMRCPLCGDSQKSKTKARGYILGRDGKYVYTCHNCNTTLPFSKFLETVDPGAYQEYLRERFTERANNTSRIIEPVADISKFITPKFIKYTALSNLKKISQLPIEHPARRYVVSRKIPAPYHSRLFYAPKFKAFTNTLLPDKFDLTKADEPRLLIPLVDKEKNLFGFQGRAFGPVEPRYITIILDHNKPKVFNLDQLNTRERVYVVEGPIDAMFLHNCIAMCGSHLDKTVETAGVRPENVTVVYDNEPRNKEIVASIDKAISNGYSVCIWPETIEHKDINDMVKAGMSPEKIQSIIDEHTYKDLLAKMKLVQWKRV